MHNSARIGPESSLDWFTYINNEVSLNARLFQDKTSLDWFTYINNEVSVNAQLCQDRT